MGGIASQFEIINTLTATLVYHQSRHAAPKQENIPQKPWIRSHQCKGLHQTGKA